MGFAIYMIFPLDVYDISMRFGLFFKYDISRGFLWEFSKCLISQNIGCLIKTQLKNSTQTFFLESRATLILNSMFVVVVLYCVQLVGEVKIAQNHSLL